MQLSTYLAENALSMGEFARRINAKNARTVQRYCKGVRIPSRRLMAEIERETRGQVNASDFFRAAAVFDQQIPDPVPAV